MFVNENLINNYKAAAKLGNKIQLPKKSLTNK